ncbi:MAG: tetratricopeptide repeat protein, partial [Myxococcota bacterium]
VIGVAKKPSQADPFEAELAFQKGQEAASSEQWDDAERLFRRAIERAPSEGEYVAALAETLAARESLDEAATLLERATDLSPASRAVRLARARHYRRTNDDNNASDWYGSVLKLDPDCREAREFLAAKDKLFTRRTGLFSRLTKA